MSTAPNEPYFVHDADGGLERFATYAAARAEFRDRIDAYLSGTIREWTPEQVVIGVVMSTATVHPAGSEPRSECVESMDDAMLQLFGCWLRSWRRDAGEYFGGIGPRVVEWLESRAALSLDGSSDGRT